MRSLWERPILSVDITPTQLHTLFELAAYALGFRLFLRERRRFAATADMSLPTRLTLIAGAVVGAAIGSRLSWWLQDPQLAFANFPNAVAMMQGKSILGGLLGGVIGVEIAKWRAGVLASTGDAFVVPIIAALIVGRIGCHLTGLSDHTTGLPSLAVWALDFGDGIARHPSALYEIAFLIVWAGVIALLAPRLNEPGDRFRLLLLGYLTFRFCAEYLKPIPFVYPLGLSGLQYLCVAGLLYYAPYLPRILPAVLRRST